MDKFAIRAREHAAILGDIKVQSGSLRFVECSQKCGPWKANLHIVVGNTALVVKLASEWRSNGV
jgi:hypothetical protein